MNKIITSKGVIDLTIPADARTNADGEYYMVCPICTSERDPKHRAEKKFAINLKKYPYPWHCNHCDEKGYVVTEEYYQSLKIKPILNNMKTDSLSEGMKAWFWKERRISEPTLQKLKICMSTESILQSKSPNNPELKDKYATRSCINFGYYRNDQLINIKFRDKDKNFKMLTGATKIIYNIDSFKDKKKGIITEGEIDVLSYIEAGLDSEFGIGSVPNGATVSSKEIEHFKKTGELIVMSDANLEYLDLVIDDLKHLEVIYIATDDDAAGIKLREELARRLGKNRCRYIKYSGILKEDGNKCKDANDVLVSKGPLELAATIDNAIPYPIEGVHTSKEYWDDMSRMYDNGRPKGLPTGFPVLDPYFNWMRGWFYVVNGWPNNGKTSLALNLIAASTVLYKWKWGIFCAENYPEPNVIDMLAEIFVGKPLDYDAPNRMSKSEYEDVVKNFINKYYYIVSDYVSENEEKVMTPEDLREIKRDLVKKYGITGFLTDPWLSLYHDIGRSGNEDSYLVHELTKEVRIATRYNLINMITHHPKTDKDTDKAPGINQLTGGKVWWIKAYGAICVHRKNIDDWKNSITEFHVQKEKDFKAAGELTNKSNPPTLKYDRLSRRFFCQNPAGEDPQKYNVFPFDTYHDSNQGIFEGF